MKRKVWLIYDGDEFHSMHADIGSARLYQFKVSGSKIFEQTMTQDEAERLCDGALVDFYQQPDGIFYAD